jgi:glycolate oxidase iron-sulfur subunit
MGLSPVKKAIFRRLLAHPQTLDRMAAIGARFQKILTRPVNEVVGTSCARFASPLLADRHFRPLAKTPFHRLQPALNTPAGSSGLKVGFFVGCLIDKIFPAVAQAACRVLEHHRIGVFLPAKQGCCGIPAVSSGDTATFNDLVRYHLDMFEHTPFDCLVTCCATCTSTIKKVWPSLCSEDLTSRAAAIAAKTMDISQFLVKHVELTFPAAATDDGRVVTFHDSCHLKKSLGVSSEPRDLIRANPAYLLKEMPAADDCCGMGGSFNLEHYGLSARIGGLKRDNIASIGCAEVATGCPACMLQISDMLSRAGDRIAVRHPVQIYAESLNSAAG